MASHRRRRPSRSSTGRWRHDRVDSTTDATLSDLVLNDGTNDLTLTPTFASGTTTYTASVDNAILRITVELEENNSSATIASLDGSDNAIADADGMTTGHQVDLVEGANTVKVKVKVKVTAEDTTTIAAGAIGFRRGGDRGGRPGALFRSNAVGGVDGYGDGGPRDIGRHGDGGCGLHGDERDADVRGGRDVEDGVGADHRRLGGGRWREADADAEQRDRRDPGAAGRRCSRSGCASARTRT